MIFFINKNVRLVCFYANENFWWNGISDFLPVKSTIKFWYWKKLFMFFYPLYNFYKILMATHEHMIRILPIKLKSEVAHTKPQGISRQCCANSANENIQKQMWNPRCCGSGMCPAAWMLWGKRQAGLSGAALQRLQKSIEIHLHSENLVGNRPAAILFFPALPY